MADETRRYAPMKDDGEPMELNDLLEPFDSDNAHRQFFAPMQDDAYETRDIYGNAPYGDVSYNDYVEELNANSSYENVPYENAPYEEYSDYHEELDHEGRLRTAMGVFNSVSTLVGAVVILVLVGMLISLFSWLHEDIIHFLALLQSGIR